MRVRFFSLIILLFIVCKGFTQENSIVDTTSVKILIKHAKELAYNSQHHKARVLCYQILQKDNTLYDISVLLGRLYAWDKNYDSARVVLTAILVHAPGYYDAIDALIDVELWNDKYDDALRYANLGLSTHPNDEVFLYKKARALNFLGKYDDAVAIIQQVLQINPSNKDATALLESIKEKKRVNKLTVDYSVDAFKNNTPWQFLYAQLSRPTKYFGTVVARANYAYRYQQSGLQLELDAYPAIRKGTYLYLNAGYAKNNVFPFTRFGAELYQKLPKSFEASFGMRYLNFKQQHILELDSTKVLMYTATVGKYVGNYWFSLRTFITPSTKANSKSFIFIARRYFSDADSYLSISLGTGFSPDEHRYAFVDPTLYYLKSQKAYLTYQKRFAKWFISNVGLGMANEEYYPKLYRMKFSANLGLSYFF